MLIQSNLIIIFPEFFSVSLNKNRSLHKNKINNVETSLKIKHVEIFEDLCNCYTTTAVSGPSGSVCFLLMAAEFDWRFGAGAAECVFESK